MEKLVEPYSNIVTKIPYISNLIPYYGYLHECAELFKQLCKKSRKSWEDNHEAILKIIMKHKNCRLKIAFSSNLTQTIVKWLLRSNNYLYYSIYIYLESALSFSAAEKFIDSVEILSEDLFQTIQIQVGVENYILASEFIDFYTAKGLPDKCLNVVNKSPYNVRIYQRRNLIDDFNLSYFTTQSHDGSNNWKICKRCHTFEFHRNYEQDSSIQWTEIEHKVLNISNKNVEQIVNDVAGMSKSTTETLLITFRGNMNQYSRYSIFARQNIEIVNISVFKDNLDIIVNSLSNIKNISFQGFQADDQNELFQHIISNLALITNENSQYAKIRTVNLETEVFHRQITMLKENVIIAIPRESSYSVFRVSKIYTKIPKSPLHIAGDFICIDITRSTLKLYLDKVEELDASNYDFSKFEEYIKTTGYEKNSVIMVRSEDKVLEDKQGVMVNHTFSKYRSEYLLRNNTYSDLQSMPDLGLDQVKNGSIVKINFEKYARSFYGINMTDFFKKLHIGTQVDYKPPYQILELRIKQKIDDDSIIDIICDFFKTNNNLRDLELFLKNNNMICKIIDSLIDNYMIKTLDLFCNAKATKLTIEKATEFKNNRIALEIQLNTDIKRFKTKKRRISEFYYPDEFCDIE